MANTISMIKTLQDYEKDIDYCVKYTQKWEY